MDSLRCPLCLEVQHLQKYFKKKTGELYHQCGTCDLIFLDPQFYLKPEDEHKRYLTHENDVMDAGYQEYLKPVVESVLKLQKPINRGLDYGCGPSSVASYLLKAQNFQIEGYDPYFNPRPDLLKQTYDYIVCTEVVEHFYLPRDEFRKLRNLLNVKGSLYIRTALTDFMGDFEKWHYHRDPTHVVFYSKKSFQWIANTLGWEVMEMAKEKIILRRQD